MKENEAAIFLKAFTKGVTAGVKMTLQVAEALGVPDETRERIKDAFVKAFRETKDE